jgi:hypothetical protein
LKRREIVPIDLGLLCIDRDETFSSTLEGASWVWTDKSWVTLSQNAKFYLFYSIADTGGHFEVTAWVHVSCEYTKPQLQLYKAIKNCNPGNITNQSHQIHAIYINIFIKIIYIIY